MPTANNRGVEELRRLSWRCRRGLLELDIILQRFAEQYLADLTQAELAALDGLLDLPDKAFLDLLISMVPCNEVPSLQVGNQDDRVLQSVLAKLSDHYQGADAA